MTRGTEVVLCVRPKINVSWHPAAHQFVRCVGYAIGRDGRPKPKCFYRGTDEAAAIAVTTKIKAEWENLRASGLVVWAAEPMAVLLRANAAPPVVVAQWFKQYSPQR